MSVRPREIGQAIDLQENRTREYHVAANFVMINERFCSPQEGHNPIFATAGGCTNTHNHVNSVRLSNWSCM